MGSADRRADEKIATTPSLLEIASIESASPTSALRMSGLTIGSRSHPTNFPSRRGHKIALLRAPLRAADGPSCSDLRARDGRLQEQVRTIRTEAGG